MAKKQLAGGPAVNTPEEEEKVEKKEWKSNKESNRKYNKRRRLVGWVLLSLFGLLTLFGFLLAFMLKLQGEEENVNVAYSVMVATDITAKYQIAGQEEVEVGSISFDPDKGEYLSQQITFGDIRLTKTNASVLFTYAFANKDDVNCAIILRDNAAKNNIRYSFSIFINDVEVEEFDLEKGVEMKPGEVCVIKQNIEVVDSSLNAYYTSGEGAALVWILEEATSEAENV